MQIDWVPVTGRTDEGKLHAILDQLVDAEKPHDMAVPVVALRGELMDVGEGRVVFEWERATYSDEYGLMLRGDLIAGDDADGDALNQTVFDGLGMEVGSRYVTHLDDVWEVAFVGWSLKFLNPEDRKRIAEEQSA